MVVEFEEALDIARECVRKRTGDADPMVLRYERRDTFFFQFRTSKGDIDIIVDPYGEVGHCFEERPSDEDEPSLARAEAVEKALANLGGGKVEVIKAKSGGYELQIDLGDKGETVLFVDRHGEVYREKCSVLTRNLVQDID